MSKKAKHNQEDKPMENGFNEELDNSNNDQDYTGTDTEEQEDQVAVLESTVAQLKDKQLRLLAEFENYKKRNVRERLELMNTASRDLILSLLPVLDDFDRARKSAEEGSKGEHWSEGVSLVYNRLYQVLQSAGLKAMESTGQAFDPDFHEAITEMAAPSPDLAGKIIDTVEKGYMLNDKIIRHAKVVVGK
jgi:molecular chaperone GrpE